MNNCIYDAACSSPVTSRGLCHSHYYKLQRTGELESIALPVKHKAPQHRLSNKDTDALTATCSVCGPATPIRLIRSRNQYRCDIKQQAYVGGRGYVFGDGQTIPAAVHVPARETLRNEQQGLCALNCGRPATHLDHCHDSGAIRGLLCLKCNSGLGMFDDNVETLRAAIDYLSR